MPQTSSPCQNVLQEVKLVEVLDLQFRDESVWTMSVYEVGQAQVLRISTCNN